MESNLHVSSLKTLQFCVPSLVFSQEFQRYANLFCETEKVFQISEMQKDNRAAKQAPSDAMFFCHNLSNIMWSNIPFLL